MRRPGICRRGALAALAALVAVAMASAQAAAQTPPSAVCGPPLDASGAPALHNTADALANGTLVALIYGSSSTAGVGAGAPEAAFPAVLERALEAETSAAVAVTARGVGGEDAGGALARMRADFSAGDAADLVVWQVGTNDALGPVTPERFAQHLSDGAQAVAATGADLVLVDPQHFPRIDGQARYAAFVSAVGAAGKAARAPVVPRFARMAAAYANVGDALLANDRFHMGADGHRCLGADLAAVVLAGAAAAR